MSTSERLKGSMKSGYRAILMLSLISFQPFSLAMFDHIAETAAPHFVSGNDLYDQRGAPTSLRMYVAGVIDGNSRLSLDNVSRRYCLPSGGTLRQFSDVVVDYLARNAATRHEPASYLVRSALQDSFPCPRP